jgi:UDP-N-acetylmuramoyl-tripeptide--D-alanyl-D-alanine ligase
MATPLPPNDARFELSEVLAATGGALSGRVNDAALCVCGIATDTRALLPGQAFVALRGERFDGHDWLPQAAEAGAALAIVERDVPAHAGMTLLRVRSTLGALGALGARHLARWRARDPRRRVVAVTGSAGKTTTRRATARLLEALAPGEVHQSRGNLNNLVGVPMTLLALSERHRLAVLELGTSRQGEIPTLARMVRPNVALLTLVANAHAEGLGDLDAIAAEKAALFAELAEGDAPSVAVGNVDDARVRAALDRSRSARRVGYGFGPAAAYRIVARRPLSAMRAEVAIERPEGGGLVTLELGLIGEAGALAAAAALAVAEALGGPMPEAVAARALATEGEDPGELGPGGRLRSRELASGLVLIDDSYNSNPASCRASVAAAAEVARLLGRRLVLVLGEMRELGAESEAAHREMADVALGHGAAWLLGIGAQAERAVERARAHGLEARFAESSERAAALAVAEVRPSDVVLVKGSRGVATEVVVGALTRAHAARLGGGAGEGPRGGHAARLGRLAP